MQRETAERATLKPMMSLLAEYECESEQCATTRAASRPKKRTNIAPNGRGIADVARPDDSIDEIDKIAQKGPEDVEDCARVVGANVPWSWECEQDEREPTGGDKGALGHLVRCFWWSGRV